MGTAFAIATVAVVAAYLVLLVRARTQHRRRTESLRWIRQNLEEAGARFETPECFRWDGALHRLAADAPVLLGGQLPLRLSRFTPHVYEFSIRRARHVPPLTPRLAADDLYRHCAIDGWNHPELEEYLLAPAIRDALTELLGERWNAVWRRAVEIVLHDPRVDPQRRTPQDLRRDMELLRVLDSVPLERRLRGGTMTIRHGFEPDPWPWHWRPQERLLLPREARRFAISYWDGPWLNPALLDFLLALSQGDRILFLTDLEECPQVACAFGGGFSIAGHLFEFDTVAVAVAADLVTEGRIARAIVVAAPQFLPNLRRAYGHAGPHDFHAISLGLLPKLTAYVRRLRDDEDSWFSGEWEILTCARTPAQLERAARQAAARVGAEVRTLDRPFIPKLLKEDRLEMTA